MIEISTLEELRAIRRRLSEECKGDPARYAAMLAEFGRASSGLRITQPLTGSAGVAPSPALEAGSEPADGEYQMPESGLGAARL
jgi:hypothetical protein